MVIDGEGWVKCEDLVSPGGKARREEVVSST